MNPNAWIAIIGVVVGLSTFLLGRASKRWADQGAADAKAVALKEIADRLEAKVASIAEGAAHREEQIKSVVAKQADLKQDIDQLAERVDLIRDKVTVLRANLGYEESGRHPGIEPGKDSGGVVR